MYIFYIMAKVFIMTLLLKRIAVPLLCAVPGFKKSFPLHSLSISFFISSVQKVSCKKICGIVSVSSSRIDFFSFVFLSNLYSLEIRSQIDQQP